MPVPFNAAKDLVYTINGNNISSGGYRISKILNGKSKRKGKNAQTQEGGDGRNIFNEDSGIPVGLLLLQRLKFEPEHDTDTDDLNLKKLNSESDNNKLVYANVMTNNDENENIELVTVPSSESRCENDYSENPIEICSSEIDNELYDSLVKNVSGPQVDTVIMVKTPSQKINMTKKKHFGKHKDIEKVFQKRRTKSNRQRN